MAEGETKAVSPYQGLEARAFWRSGVAEAGRYPPADIYRPKFEITRDMPVMTAGSCFAQHVGRALRGAGFNVLDTEPAPGNIPEVIAQRHGYGLYSARYGNIYTTRQLVQLLQEARGEVSPANPVWERDGRFYDAQRPNMTPGGLDNADLVMEARAYHLRAVLEAVEKAQLVVFTFGLTEAWHHVETGTVYPTAPGTIAGEISDDYAFINYRAAQIREDFLAAREIFRAANPEMKFLLTVSPVPLTATASGHHVLPATIYSKSVLRGVAGELFEDFEDIDYFPSFEIVSSHPSMGRFFEKNLRSVHPRGVRRVMQTFLAAHDQSPKSRAEVRAERRAARAKAAQTDDEARKSDVVCEEELLEAFRK